MRNDKQAALKLRLEGKSYSQITKLLNISKSTLSWWLSGVVISEKIRRRINERGCEKSIEILLRLNRRQTSDAKSRVRIIRNKAKYCIGSLSEREIMLIGAALYWAEGYKRPIVRNGQEITHHAVSLTNSDSFLVEVFLRYLRQLGVQESRMRVSIRVFDHHDANILKVFWRKKLNLSDENFLINRAGLSISSSNKRPFNRLEYGVIQIRVYDTDLFYKIVGHIDGLKKNR